MKSYWPVVVLTLINLALLIFILTQNRTVLGQENPPVLSAQRIELVDAEGLVRARLNVEPRGEVVFRMLDQEGTIRVKLGGSQDGSVLLLLNDLTEPGIQLLATRERTSLTLTGRDGAQQEILP